MLSAQSGCRRGLCAWQWKALTTQQPRVGEETQEELGKELAQARIIRSRRRRPCGGLRQGELAAAISRSAADGAHLFGADAHRGQIDGWVEDEHEAIVGAGQLGRNLIRKGQSRPRPVRLHHGSKRAWDSCCASTANGLPSKTTRKVLAEVILRRVIGAADTARGRRAGCRAAAAGQQKPETDQSQVPIADRSPGPRRQCHVLMQRGLRSRLAPFRSEFGLPGSAAEFPSGVCLPAGCGRSVLAPGLRRSCSWSGGFSGRAMAIAIGSFGSTVLASISLRAPGKA